jgi:hypothetical protein
MSSSTRGQKGIEAFDFSRGEELLRARYSSIRTLYEDVINEAAHLNSRSSLDE